VTDQYKAALQELMNLVLKGPVSRAALDEILARHRIEYAEHTTVR
jgi:hypothetical protein